jgi:Family of unknown function (DUF6267)
MRHFISYLTEAGEKNLHLEHLEDQVLNRGVNGAREAIDFLRSLRDMLSGHVEKPINVTTKWDGAPAVFCGINPENGKFFVGTKGVFAKNAKLNYTEADIQKNHESEGLRDKLTTCLRYLPKLGIKGILQGDMMFGKGDVHSQTIEGEKYITFTPNTITYAIPLHHTALADSILKAQMGIVFHTEYRGKTMASLKSSFKIDIGYLNHSKDVWFRDASLVDQSGTATFTASETEQIGDFLSKAGTIFQGINGKILNQIALNEVFRGWIKQFNNTKVREGTSIDNTTTHTNEFIRWLDTKLTAAIGEAKQPDTKRKRTQEKTTVLGFFRDHRSDLKSIFDLQNALTIAKLMIVHKLNQVKGTQTFLKTADGFQATAPEGFVAIDHVGNAVKLVDRLVFSKSNFIIAKSWDK